MGLFGALNVGRQAILANQRGLDIVGQNISNAENDAYSRQRVEFAALPPSRVGQLFVGNGVSVSDIRRVFDQQVENRLQGSLSTLGSLNRQSDVYMQLERVVNALGDDPANGVYVTLGGQLDMFVNELSNLASDPSSPALREVFVSRSDALATTVRTLAEDIHNLRASFNESVTSAVGTVNELSKEIADLNNQIVRAEVGGSITGKANDLRDRRDFLLRRLAEFTDFTAVEMANGATNVMVGGTQLVSGNEHMELELRVEPDRGINIVNIEYADTGHQFKPREGELGGLLLARDDILPGFMRDLDDVARTVMQTFNDVHATGRGMTGLSSVSSEAFTSTHALNGQLPISMAGTVQRGNVAGAFLVDPSLRNIPNGKGDSDFFVGAEVLFTSGLNAGRKATIAQYDPLSGRLDFNPPMSNPINSGDSYEITSFDYPIANGSFKLNLRNDVTGITDVFDIEIDRDGLPTPPNVDDTTLQDLVTDINSQLVNYYNGNAPVRARITDDYRLQIDSVNSDITFHFSDDTSGFLAAAGINTFFSGSDAMSMHVKNEIANNIHLLATGQSALPGDNSNIGRMQDVFTDKLFAGGTATIQEYWRGTIGTMGVEASTAKELATNQQLIATAATNARERISGVNIDEEAIDLIKFQRSFQASARYLGVVDQLLAELMQIV